MESYDSRNWEQILYDDFVHKIILLNNKIKKQNPDKIFIQNQYAAFLFDCVELVCGSFKRDLVFYPFEFVDVYISYEDRMKIFVQNNMDKSKTKFVTLEKTVDGQSVLNNYIKTEEIIKETAYEQMCKDIIKIHTSEEIKHFGKTVREQLTEPYLQLVSYFPIGISEREERFRLKKKSSKDYLKLLKENKADHVEFLGIPYFERDSLYPRNFEEFENSYRKYLQFFEILFEKIGSHNYGRLDKVIENSACKKQMYFMAVGTN